MNYKHYTAWLLILVMLATLVFTGCDPVETTAPTASPSAPVISSTSTPTLIETSTLPPIESSTSAEPSPSYPPITVITQIPVTENGLEYPIGFFKIDRPTSPLLYYYLPEFVEWKEFGVKYREEHFNQKPYNINYSESSSFEELVTRLYRQELTEDDQKVITNTLSSYKDSAPCVLIYHPDTLLALDETLQFPEKWGEMSVLWSATETFHLQFDGFKLNLEYTPITMDINGIVCIIKGLEKELPDEYELTEYNGLPAWKKQNEYEENCYEYYQKIENGDRTVYLSVWVSSTGQILWVDFYEPLGELALCKLEQLDPDDPVSYKEILNVIYEGSYLKKAE